MSPVRRRLTSAAPGSGELASQAASARMGSRGERSRLTDLFEEQARGCTSPEELGCLLEQVTRELGFHYFALLHHRGVQSNSDYLIRLDNYPHAWEQELLNRHDVAADPVHLASLRTNAGIRMG